MDKRRGGDLQKLQKLQKRQEWQELDGNHSNQGRHNAKAEGSTAVFSSVTYN